MIYFIGNTSGAIKIGLTNKDNIKQRLSQLQSSTPEKLSVLGVIKKGGMKQEKGLHRKFSHLKIRGEWFYPDEELLNYISSNCDKSKDNSINTWIGDTIHNSAINNLKRRIETFKKKRRRKANDRYEYKYEQELKCSIDERVKRLAEKHKLKNL